LTTSTRLGVGPLRWLPLFLPGLMLFVAVLLAPVSPAKATEGLYRLDTPEFAIVDGFDCAMDDIRATCTVPVAGRPLTVEVDVGPHSTPCTATYDGRDLSCERVTEYGPASAWLRVGSLGVPASAAPDSPWWRDVRDIYWDRVWLFSIPSLGLIAALAAFLLYRGPRLEDPNRMRRTAATGLICWTFPAVTSLLVTPWDKAESGLMALIIPHTVLLPACAMALWQHLAAGPLSGRLRGRFGQAAIAFVATALFSAGGLLWLALAAGLPD
jgi:hypothetical protein